MKTVESGDSETFDMIESVIASVDAVSSEQCATEAELISEADGQSSVVLTLPEDVSLDMAMVAAANNDDVLYVQPNYCYQLTDFNNGDSLELAAELANDSPGGPLSNPNDAYVSSQWGLGAVHALDAWDLLSTGVKPVTVAVVDTGTRLTHKDIRNNLAKGLSGSFLAWDAVEGVPLEQSSIYPLNCGDLAVSGQGGHGTHVSGLIAAEANNSLGIAGIGTNLVKVLPIRVFYVAQATTNGQTSQSLCTTSALLNKAYDYLIRHLSEANIKVVNLSLGGCSPNDVVLRSKIEDARQLGILTVAAAGNSSVSDSTPTAAMYPSDWDAVLSVTAVTKALTHASYSDHNPAKNIAAPGGDATGSILSLSYASDSGVMGMYGTSMSCPFVAGAAALVFAVNPNFTPSDVQNILCSTAEDGICGKLDTPGRDDFFGYGLLNLEKALAAAKIFNAASTGNGSVGANSGQVSAGGNSDEVGSGGGSSNPGSPDTNTDANTVVLSPKILSQPVSGSAIKGRPAAALSVKVGVVANGKLSYQWYSNSACTASGAKALTGAVSATYSPLTTKVGVTYYYCKVTNTVSGSVARSASTTTGIVSVAVAADFDKRVVKIWPASKANMSFGVKGGSKTSKAPITLAKCIGQASQRFYLARTADGSYTLKNVNSGLYLTVNGNKAVAGAAMVQSKGLSGSRAQRFWLLVQPNGSYRLVSALSSGYCLDILNNSTKNGAALQLASVSTTDKCQEFTLVEISPDVPSGTIVTVRSVATKRYLGVSGCSKAVGAELISWTASGQAEQRFKLTYHPTTGYYTITAMHSKKVLAVEKNTVTKAGSQVVQANFGSALDLQWNIKKESSNRYSIRSAPSGLAMAVLGASKALGTPTIVWGWQESYEQLWTLTKVG